MAGMNHHGWSLWCLHYGRKRNSEGMMGTCAYSFRTQTFAALARAFAPRHAAPPPPLSSRLSPACGGQPVVQRESTFPYPHSFPTVLPSPATTMFDIGDIRKTAPFTSFRRSGFGLGPTEFLGTPRHHASATSRSATAPIIWTSPRFSTAFRAQRRHSPIQAAIYRRICTWYSDVGAEDKRQEDRIQVRPRPGIERPGIMQSPGFLATKKSYLEWVANAMMLFLVLEL